MAPSAHSPRPFRTRAVTGAAVGVLLVLVLAACGSDSGSGDATATTTTTSATDATTGGESTVVATDFSLTSITVAPGATVTLQNGGQVPHTMTADKGAFDTNAVDPGSSAKIAAPTAAGAYAFHCKIHPSMTATLTVEG